MIDPLQVVEAVRPLFPHGVTLLQHMVSQSINAVPVLCGGIFHGATITTGWLVDTMLEEAMCPEVRAPIIAELETAFREAASAISIDVRR